MPLIKPPTNSVPEVIKHPSNPIVDKIYDSDSKLVVQESDNSPDNTYKKIEEDDKSPDELDKIRAEMIGKSNSGDSIIHDVDFSKVSKDKNSDKTSDNDNADKKKIVEEISDGSDKKVEKVDDVNKEVVNSILDYNSSLKNKTVPKVIAPESGNSGSIWWTPETRGSYSVLKDYVLATVPSDYNMRSITYTTQGSTDFFEHAPFLCDRWNDGFISLSVYAPGDDFRLAINMIYYLRQCSLKCVKERITWHMIFDTAFQPKQPISAPETFLEASNFDCSASMDDNMAKLGLSSTFRKDHHLPYPINVLRNVARLGSKTKYLLASDIELYPSVGIVPAFFGMLDREQKGQIDSIDQNNPHVYHLPIFEVEKNVKSPRTKKELIKLYLQSKSINISGFFNTFSNFFCPFSSTEKAIFFHKFVCDACQNYPDRYVWIKEPPANESAMNVFRATKRLRSRNQWEPLYIGTNAEPFYDERLTWDGKRDKMSQVSIEEFLSSSSL